MIRVFTYSSNLANLKSLDEMGRSDLASQLQKEILIEFLREARFTTDEDEEICQMILHAVADRPNV